MTFRLLLAAMTAALVSATAAQAAPIQTFDTAVFKAAQSEGRPILVDAHAGWCPICAIQNPTLQKLAADPAYDKLLILRVNYDKQNAEKRALGITRQSTLIAYNGARETGRSVGETKADKITALARTALN